MTLPEPNYLAHAFRSRYNLAGLVLAAALVALTRSTLVLVVAALAEAAVLTLVSGDERFRRVVRARLLARGERAPALPSGTSPAEMLPLLPDAERQRFRALQGLTDEIRQNYRGMDASSQVLVDELVGKLDFLLDSYLRTRFALSRYAGYLRTAEPARIEARIAEIEAEMRAAPERIRQVKSRTHAVLKERLDRCRRAVENRDLVEAQMEGVQEMLQLLRDQSYSVRDPRGIADRVDGLIRSAEETERSMKDLEEILALEQDALAASARA
jgi:hypothetical protein